MNYHEWPMKFFINYFFRIRVYSCVFVFKKKLLSIDVPVVDGLWCGQRWSLKLSEIVSDAVIDSLRCRRFFCFSKSKSDFSEWRAKLACALPSAKAFRAKLKDLLGWRCKWSARRMQSWARSSYAEPQPSLAMHLKCIAKVRTICDTSKFRPSWCVKIC